MQLRIHIKGPIPAPNSVSVRLWELCGVIKASARLYGGNQHPANYSILLNLSLIEEGLPVYSNCDCSSRRRCICYNIRCDFVNKYESQIT